MFDNTLLHFLYISTLAILVHNYTAYTVTF
jgi:hypothetical protein